MNTKLLFIIIYIYISITISSCVARCDYNVFFAFGLLLLFRSYYDKDSKYYAKIILHLHALLCIADIIWMCVFIPNWNTESPTMTVNHIAGIRMYVIVVSFIELGFKLFIGWLIFSDYKEKHNADMKYLAKFDYKKQNVDLTKTDYF